MRQAKIVTADRFSVESTPVPRLQGPGELRLRTAACGICSGDLMPWYLQRKAGSVLGHEVVGWAADVGPAVTGIRPGDLIFVHHHAPCMDCCECRRGAFVHCPAWRQSKLDPGGMAEWIRVPAGIVQHDCFPVRDLGVEQAVFIEPLACTVKALSRLPVLEGSTGMVVGCGVMGLLNIAGARVRGAARVVAVEPDETRRRAALAFGADAALTPGEAAETCRHLADFVVIGPGHPDIIVNSLDYVRPGGTALLFTPTPTATLTALDLGELYFREVSLVPSYSCGPADTRLACRWLQDGLVHPERLITHRFDLEHVQEAYDTARGGGPALKVLVTFPPGGSP